jgi:catechol 2,3-dioxygenase-like lactoylglutathione lyase family enzyme
MRFNHITLIVADLERSKEFYGTLGLLQIVDAPPRYARFRFPEGDATLSVEVTGEATPPSSSQLFFECAALDQTVAELKSKGLVFEQDPTDMSYSGARPAFATPTGTICVCTLQARIASIRHGRWQSLPRLKVQLARRTTSPSGSPPAPRF